MFIVLAGILTSIAFVIIAHMLLELLQFFQQATAELWV